MMSQEYTQIKDLMGLIKPLSEIYDDMRVVDPVDKKVYELKEGKIIKSDLACFKFWGRNRVCDNCIALRALNENDSYVKIENNAKKAYIVTAIPLTFYNKKLVLEILKNITKSLFIVDSDNNQTVEVYGLIDTLNALTIKDGLTDIFNRRYLNERLPVEIVNSTVTRTPLSVIMADIDHFKNVNDLYGHMAGDLVLKKFAQILDEYADNQSGWVARYGGEEFFICLPHIDFEAATEIAEKMRAAVEREVIKYKEDKIKVTASFGVSSIDGYFNIKPDDLIEAADKNLYIAKNEGRNMVVATTMVD